VTPVGGGDTDPTSSARRSRWLVAALLLGATSARAATLTVQDGPVVLGKTESSSVVILVDEAPGTEGAPLRLSVNVGAFSEPTRFAPGRYRATYTPPSTRFPQMALVAVWRETAADVRPDFLRLPLLGMARVPVTARPGAKVRVRLGAETFGPVQADRHGRAEVPVLVPPGSSQCDVILKDRRGELVRHVPVEVPPYNRLTAALVPHAAPADGRSEVQLFVFYDLSGAEVPPERVRVTPSAGAVSLRHAARGLYTFAYTTPAGAAAPSVSFAVSIAGDPTARATAVLSLRGAPPPPPPARSSPAPARVVVTTPATPLRPGASALVDVLVLDASGAGLPGLDVSATANGDPLPAAAPRGDGHYELRFTAPAAPPPGGAVQIEAVAQHADTFAFGTAKIQVEAPPAPPPPARPAAVRPAPPEPRVVRAAPEPRATIPAAVAAADGDGEDRPAPRRSPGAAPRREAGRFLAGVSGGYVASPGVAAGLRPGAELWAPIRVGDARLGVGIHVGVGTASTTASDPAGTVRSTIDAVFVPVALKLGYELYGNGRFSLALGAGPVAAYAQFRSSLASTSEQAVGLGWTSFLDAGWVLGPGVAVLGLSYGSAVVNTVDYRIDPGGFSAAVGYRVRVF
jgi:hypothetical protein